MVYDVIVIGAGIIGSATAYHLAKTQKTVLLLEQFHLPHARGSSHGASRIIRKGYDKTFNYAGLMEENESIWKTLQKETSMSLFQDTGFLFVARPPFDVNVTRTEQSLAAQNLSHRHLTAEEINSEFPMMKFSPEMGDVGVYEPSGGVIKSSKALDCFLKMFVHYGGHLRDGEYVRKITPVDDDNIFVETSTGKYQSNSVIISAGSWTSKLTESLGLRLPLQAKRIKVCYWRQRKDNNGIEDGFPCFVADGLGDDLGIRNYMYGLPSLEYPLHVKICSHYGQLVDPDDRDKDIDMVDVEDLCRFVSNYFPGLQDKPSIVESCIITVTPDEEFIIDKHPNFPNVVIGAGFSGRGFKLAPVIGKLLSQLAVKDKPSYNLELFKIKRFSKAHLKANM